MAQQLGASYLLQRCLPQKRDQMKAGLVYPHQLFSDSPLLSADVLYLIEEPLYFTQYKFHKQKLIYHRASMKAYAAELEKAGKKVQYIDSANIRSTVELATILKKDKIKIVSIVSLDDYWLDRDLKRSLKGEFTIEELPNPHFLTPQAKIQEYTPKGKFFYFHDFYISQRKALNILVKGGKPEGGKWSFDAENRQKLPASVKTPKLPNVKENQFTKEAITYVSKIFSNNPGYGDACLYPCTRTEALNWVDNFFKNRYQDFGLYEDAICKNETVLFHSLFTPFLNVGLVSPEEIINIALKTEAPLNSKEGFIRQIIGWREFIRLIYARHGSKQRTTNFLENKREIPKKFYTATTGIEPLDGSIRKVMDSAYCHHIERLMVLGNFMLLCDIHPDAVYQWFMELFIDAYDWVMVPNVYGMSQYADGGLMTTKPYISGSAYILKMSDYKKGDWCSTWDGLYWRFIDKHYDLIKKNPRMSVMSGMRDKLKANGSLKDRLYAAETFLDSL
jgi:deoxyribodipyrimidine photolyase-related protein